MSLLPTPFSLDLYNYYQSLGFREHPLLAGLREENKMLPQRNFQAAPEVVHFLSFLIPLLSIQSILELGTFTGYSSLAFALALSEEGKIVTCDKDPSTTQIAQQYWEKGGVRSKIDLRLRDAMETLQILADEQALFDFIFIDANKSAYGNYYEACLPLLSPTGLMAIDNTLWRGEVALPSSTNNQTNTIKILNERIHQDPRINMVMLPIADGLTLVRKVEPIRSSPTSSTFP